MKGAEPALKAVVILLLIQTFLAAKFGCRFVVLFALIFNYKIYVVVIIENHKIKVVNEEGDHWNY